MKKKIKYGLLAGFTIFNSWIWFQTGRSYRSFEIMMNFLENKKHD